MKFFSSYIKSFDTVMVLVKNLEVTRTKKDENAEVLYSGEEPIGFNIFGMNLEGDYHLEDSRLYDIAKPFLEKYFKNIEIENQFIVSKIVSAEKIPDTHLTLCKVLTGKEELQIVCGAPNARIGLMTTLATVGSWLPNGIRIGSGKLKGFDSFGMLCSGREIKINDEKFNKPGIMEWDLDDSFIGKSIWGILNEK